MSRLPPDIHAAFRAVVLDGTFADDGMESLADRLWPPDVEAIHACSIGRQACLFAASQPHTRRP